MFYKLIQKYFFFSIAPIQDSDFLFKSFMEILTMNDLNKQNTAIKSYISQYTNINLSYLYFAGFGNNLTTKCNNSKQISTQIASLAMNLIALKNFKSYEHQVINNLSPNINIIIGKNGQGKSNFFKAIIFALTDRIAHNKTQYNSHLHKAMDNTAQPIIVQLYVRSKLNQQHYDQNIYKLQRIWQNESTEDLRVDQKTFSKAEYESFVQSLGFSYSNSYNIIQQGKVNQVITMDQFDIYKLLEEATGMKKYEKRLQQALGYMKKNEEQKQEIKNILKEVETRLHVYQSRKQEFQYYSLEEKANKLKNKAQCQTLMNKFSKQILQFKEKESISSEQITKIKIKVKEVQNQIEQMNSDITVNQKQIYQHYDQSTIDDEMNLSISLTQDQKQHASKIKKIKTNKDKLKKELQKMSKEVEKVNNEMKTFKEKYQFFTSLIETQKMAKQGKEKSSQQIQRYIKKSQENIKQIENQLKKIQKMKSQYKIPVDISEKNEIIAKKEALNQILYELKGNKIKFFEASRQKNQFESQVDVFTQQISVCYTKMRKVLPLLQFNILNELRRQNVKGIYGFLIQFVEIQPNVMFAYQMSGLNKLCTLIVQNQQVCQIVVNLIKKLKCKQINIMPLSFMKKQPYIKKNLPNLDDCYSLLNEDWIKVKSHSFGQQFTRNVEKIMINSFNNHMLVKDYDLGLKISKQYHLNCITADKEIVYSQGYLCKVGKDLNVDDKLQSYFKYAQKDLALQQSSKKLVTASQQVLVLQNKEIQLMTKKAGLESEIRNLEIKIDVINQKKRSFGKLQQEEETLANKKLKYQQQIAKKQQILANYDKKMQTKVNMNEFKEVQQLYNSKLKIYNQKSEEQSQLQRKLSEIVKQEQDLHEQMKNISGQISFQKQLNVSFVGGKQYKQKLQKQNDGLRNKKQKLEKQLMNLTQILSEKQTQNYNYLGNITILEEQTDFYQQKIDQIGTLNITLQEVEQQSNSFSMSFNRIDQKRKVRIYTTLQRLMFSKIEGYISKHKQFLAKFQELQRCQKQINEMISKFQVQKNESVNKVFLNFQKEFDNIFKAITLNGKTDVRLKKVNDKTRGIVKIKNSISIMVSFEGERQMIKKWSQFSGGQKTVIAICLLMALQKCQPAPFYILDEIDSALDTVYLQRIVSLIRRESAHSQYFISSFKPQMLEFSEQQCNYYLVENIDRVSNLKRISQQQAKRAIDGIMVN